MKSVRHGALLKRGAEAGEVVLILPTETARILSEMVDAAAKANPRKTTWKQLAKELEGLEIW